jgi:hypothetical protein
VSAWPRGRARDGGIDRIPHPYGALWLCGKHAVAPDPDGVLQLVGATTIVCLNERRELVDRYPAYVAWLDDHDGAAVWFPIPDLHAPECDVVVPVLVGLDERLRHGERMIVHCGAGIGRAGTIATALLMVAGASVDDALRTVAEHRPMAGPEVGAQRTLIDALDATLRR